MESSRQIGLWLGVVVFGALLSIPAPEAIGEAGWHVIAVAALMLSWWVSEAIPIPVTAMLPIILFPSLDVMPIKQATASYAHPIVFLFMGGFLIALAMEKWQLHKRIALGIVRQTGTHVNGIVLGFMIATAFLSMWMSNTATTVMMLPIATSVLALLLKDDHLSKGEKYFALSLMLGVAYAANIGGTATIIGTPPNAIFAGFVEERFDYQIDFANWLMIGIPFMLVMLGLCWVVLTIIVYPSKLGHLQGADEVIESQWKNLGAMTRGEKLIAVVFFITAMLWIFRRFIPIDGLTDTGIAMVAAVSLFLIPVQYKKGTFLLEWDDTKRLPWGILLLFGGGLTLASAMQSSGLVDIIGAQIAPLSAYGLLAVLLGVICVVLLMTEMMSNLALITVFLPVLAGMALQLNENPLFFVIPATLASSCAFLLPMSTPPNAIVFASGHIRVFEMVRAGIVMNIISITIIAIVAYTLLRYVFNIEAGVIPDWAMR